MDCGSDDNGSLCMLSEIDRVPLGKHKDDGLQCLCEQYVQYIKIKS